ncbi:MAG: anaerobic ribonucleoside triphosphate reductase [candidate division CPR1 bacterium ADurb.Bin160]|uniref:Anaerobic ribonucleoside triphosphate reductase n=1 Tax=candidate division CPR1 bacterium ADurb.Bin160 TaxID=1852826 RepID=A0A1V5ZLC6_9BACT|nr:MAG: anaerobic ribonucleoside triphosphate reductase [candidate division CPR1 bacterium ADurb.Bin160]
MFDNSSINQASKSVYKSLQNRIIKEYKKTDVEESYEIADQILQIHGMDKERFSIIDQIEKFIEGKINFNSVDDNSNKSEKTIKGILKEATNPIDKIVGYRYLYREMTKHYGKKEAKYLTGLMYDFTLALSDSTNILIPYCWAFDASKLITMGKPFGQLPSSTVQRVDSYISLLNEVIHQMSNHLAGAIAIGTFFIDIAHLLILKEKITLDVLKEDKTYRKYVKNQYQRFVHGVNSLSRSGGAESPFTNVSLFDREKLKKLIGEEYNWYFADPETMEMLDEEKINYVIEYIIELQNIYMEFFDKGDPLNDGMPYRFPVSTLNISKKINKDNEYVIEDKQFLKSACKKDIYRYNIFVSESNKVASCCRLLSDLEMLDLASQANSFGAGGSISLGSHRVIALNFVRFALLANTYDEFFELMKTHINNAKKILFAHKQLISSLTEVQLFLKLGWINIDRLFSTVGVIGYVEAEEILKKRFKVKNDVMIEIMTKLNEFVNNENEEFKGCIFNIEQIPGESMSHRLARADKILFGEKAVPYNIYSNQIIPLWNQEATLWERMKRDGEINKLLTGGGIVHINTGEHITGKQAEKVIDYAVRCGCEHFAITGTFCKCEDGHVLIGNTTKCVKCGKEIKQKVARTVGFFVDVDDMSYYKQEYDHNERKQYSNGDFDPPKIN